MRFPVSVALPVAVLSVVSLVNAEVTSSAVRSAGQSASAQATQTGANNGATITVPQGTTIPLTLVTPIKSKSTKPGDTVRAVVAFPVTIGTAVAIPAGTYVEGVVNSVTVRAKTTKMPAVAIHFTRLLYANGYSVTLDAASSQAMVVMPNTEAGTYELADAEFGAPRLFADGQSTPPPLPSNGPPVGVIVGVSAGVGVGIIALTYALAHKRGNTDYILFDNGWQVQMVVAAPLMLDAGRVAAAAN